MAESLQAKKVLPYVLCVEGNIGSGKSTLLSNLAKCGFTVIPEPVHEIWGQYLPQLYQDLKRWGFCFQMEAMDWFRQLQSTKFEYLLRKMNDNDNDNEQKQEEEGISDDDEYHDDKENMGDYLNEKLSPKKQLFAASSEITKTQKKVIIVERSALSAIGIFAKNLLDTKNMTEWEYSLLQRFYSMIAWEPKHILYLQVDPQICCQRIQKRNRDGEGNVDPILIRNLHNKHDALFDNNNQNVNKTNNPIIISESQNVIIVDGQQSANCVLQEALRKISNIEAKI